MFGFLRRNGGEPASSQRQQQPTAARAPTQNPGQAHPTLRNGDRGAPVQNLQQTLQSLGYDVGPVDGVWGRKTDAAVRTFQRDRGLKVDGVVGTNTWTSLTSTQAPSDSYLAQQYGEPARSEGERPTAAEVRREPDWATSGSGSMDHAPFDVDAGAYQRAGLDEKVFQLALDAYDRAWKRGETRSSVFSVVDYSLKSTERRFFTIDLASGRLLHAEYMAHGEGTGDHFHAEEFSNRGGSHQSSLGMMRTAETYTGSFGHSLKLDGLENGINDAVRRRTIVMHGQQGVEDGVAENGRSAALTWGCLGLDPARAGEVIETIKGGSLIFSYYPDPDYFQRSKYFQQ